MTKETASRQPDAVGRGIEPMTQNCVHETVQERLRLGPLQRFDHPCDVSIEIGVQRLLGRVSSSLLDVLHARAPSQQAARAHSGAHVDFGRRPEDGPHAIRIYFLDRLEENVRRRCRGSTQRTDNQNSRNVADRRAVQQLDELAAVSDLQPIISERRPQQAPPSLSQLQCLCSS